MITHLIDTNILGYFVRRNFPVLNMKLQSAMLNNTVAISVLTRAETLYGVALMQTDDKRRQSVPALLADLPTLTWESRHADAYALIDAVLTKSGQSIGVVDAMIAAHAQVEKLTLVTHNVQHFARIPDLKIEDWTQAPASA